MKIGAIGIRTKIIVGDAATWHLVKKYIDGKLVGGIDDVPEELKKYVRVLGSWVDVTSELDKLAEYPEFEDLEFSHTNITYKNSEAAFQHVDTTTVKTTLDEADKVALWDSVTGKVMLSNALNDIETILASI